MAYYEESLYQDCKRKLDNSECPVCGYWIVDDEPGEGIYLCTHCGFYGRAKNAFYELRGHESVNLY